MAALRRAGLADHLGDRDGSERRGQRREDDSLERYGGLPMPSAVPAGTASA